MLKRILEALRARGLLEHMLKHFSDMLDDGEWMFDTATAVLMREKEAGEVRDAIFARDKKVNEEQRQIRKELVEHLTVAPGVNASACLVLMSVIKDAERIGDYCKNIYQVADIYGGNFEHGPYAYSLRQILLEIKGMFSRTKHAFNDSDTHLAEQVMTALRSLTKRCDMMISQLIRDNLPTEQAVAYALLSRYFKRVAAHLANIASAVISPVHLIDFVDESPSEELRGGV